jgi:CRP-like cAMP-binding protein/Fe-S-cluster-containing dehydrogenase component
VNEKVRERLLQRQRNLATPADVSALRGLPLFSGIPEKARDKVIEKVAKFMHFVTFEPREVILHQGAYNDSAFFIVDGSVEVLIEEPKAGSAQPQPRGGAHQVGPRRGAAPAAAGMLGRGRGTSETLLLAASPVAASGTRVLEKGDIFGEISAISRFVVSATVRARTRLKVLRIQARGVKTLGQTSKDFKKFLDARYRERALMTHLKQVALFEGVEDAFLMQLKEKVELLSYEAGQVIVQEGAPADSFYLVRGGYVKVAVRAGSAELAVTYLRKGDYAGEAALLLEQPWPFSLRALESVELVRISQQDFQELLAQYPQVADRFWPGMIARLKARGAVTRDPTSAEYTQMAMETGLIHGESVLLIDLATCTHCDECVRGCASVHGGMPRFVREGERYRNWLIPTSCYQCTDPVCMIDCPTGAITRESDSLIVTINAHDHATRPCIGCGNCATRCPWNNIVMVPFGKRPDGKPNEQATKCDLCSGRADGPACVQMCPQGSAVRISFRDLDRVVEALDRRHTPSGSHAPGVEARLKHRPGGV